MANAPKEVKVLIADDDPKVIESLNGILVTMGFKVISASNGFDALDKAKLNSPSLIITDINMPKKTGLELCKEFKNYKQLRDVPVIYMTERYDTYDRLGDMNMLDHEHIAKPFEDRDIITRVKTILNRPEFLKETIFREPVSNLFNKRYIEKKLREEVNLYVRYNRIFSIILFRIDNYQKIFNSYNPAITNEIIRRVADTISLDLREVDYAARVEDNDFLIVMPDINNETCYNVANRILEKIAKLRPASDSSMVTVSGGIATVSKNQIDPDKLVMIASDTAKKAQKEGGNIVINSEKS
ncbi:MAG: diguanylate cyclase [Calditrichaeota bacterium]|nr:diguanylate cyclase [Calditrichota bacterium]